jgi:hypothetical protein
MAEAFTQLAKESTGNKIRENTRTIATNEVREQYSYQTARQTYLVIAEDCAFANSKQHISIYNGAGSGKTLRISKLFMINMLANVTVSGGARRLDVKRATNFSGGSDLAPLKHDTLNDDVSAEILFKTGATVTEGVLLFPLVFPDDEMLLTQNSAAQQIFSGINWIPEGIEIQELTLNEGEGMTIKQRTNSTAGITTWIIVFTLE